MSEKIVHPEESFELLKDGIYTSFLIKFLHRIWSKGRLTVTTSQDIITDAYSDKSAVIGALVDQIIQELPTTEVKIVRAKNSLSAMFALLVEVDGKPTTLFIPKHADFFICQYYDTYGRPNYATVANGEVVILEATRLNVLMRKRIIELKDDIDPLPGV